MARPNIDQRGSQVALLVGYTVRLERPVLTNLDLSARTELLEVEGIGPKTAAAIDQVIN